MAVKKKKKKKNKKKNIPNWIVVNHYELILFIYNRPSTIWLGKII